jgi:hypothetical protein
MFEAKQDAAVEILRFAQDENAAPTTLTPRITNGDTGAQCLG